jgi:hypothetical protein
MWSLIAVVIVYLSWDIKFHGPIFRNLVSVFSVFFAKHRSVGAVLGIKYYRSDSWETNRSETCLMFPTFGVLRLIGIEYAIGRDEDIRALKQRQSNPSRDMNLTNYIYQILGKRVSVAEVEEFLIQAWLSELSVIYNIPAPQESYIKGLKTMRLFFSLRRTNLLKALKLLYTNWNDFKAVRLYLKTLKPEERIIMLIATFTTIDNSLHNLITDPRPIAEFRDIFRNAPVGSIPVYTKGRMAICDIVANDADNPGNSAFGPKGLICPGNRVTSVVLKSIADLKRNFSVQVEGQPELRIGAGRKIWNPDQVFMTFVSKG